MLAQPRPDPAADGRSPRVAGSLGSPRTDTGVYLFDTHTGALTAHVDCCDRTIVGWRLSRSGIARVAASALENALRDRQVDSTTGLALHSDNGLVFGAKAFVRVARRYGLHQEYITPYSPEQNG